MSEATVDRVVRVIVEAAGLGTQQQIGADTPLVGSGLSLDSTAVLEMLVGLEKEFGVEVDADDLLQAQALGSVGALAAFIDAKVASGG
jgi:acyl carrier protein